MSSHFIDQLLHDLACFFVSSFDHNLLRFPSLHKTLKLLLLMLDCCTRFSRGFLLLVLLLRLSWSFLNFRLHVRIRDFYLTLHNRLHLRYKRLEKRVGLIDSLNLLLRESFTLAPRQGFPSFQIVGLLRRRFFFTLLLFNFLLLFLNYRPFIYSTYFFWLWFCCRLLFLLGYVWTWR